VTTFIFDLDGTLYLDGAALPGAVDSVRELARVGHQVLYATNDASLTGDQHTVRLQRLGFPAERAGVLTAGELTARWLAERPEPPRRVMVLGPAAVAAEISEYCPSASVESGADADAVVVGLDHAISYDRLTQAFRAVDAGATLVATNGDRCYPGSDGLLPGAGAITAAIETASGRSATVLGKPSPDMYAMLMARHGADPSDTVVVGDSLATDMVAAERLSLYRVLVLTGVTTVPPDQEETGPQLVIPSLDRLLPELTQRRAQARI
jgi:HAD superfamily hydrolase (TIGR01450 family)